MSRVAEGSLTWYVYRFAEFPSTMQARLSREIGGPKLERFPEPGKRHEFVKEVFQWALREDCKAKLFAVIDAALATPTSPQEVVGE